MLETRESLRTHFESVRAQLKQAIAGLTNEQMTETTLDGWSVKDNLAHIAFWDDLRAEEIVRISADHDSVLKMTQEQDEQANELAYQLRRNLSPAQVLWELDHSHQRLLDAIAGAAGRGLDPEAYGDAGLLSSHDAQHAEYIRNWRARRGY